MSPNRKATKGWKIFEICLDMINTLLHMAGGIVLLFQELKSVKLLIHALESTASAPLGSVPDGLSL
jgi:hypothetical protein